MQPSTEPDFEALRLGETTTEIPVETADRIRAATLALIRQVRGQFDVFSQGLDAPIFDDDEVMEALRRRVIDRRRMRARFLAHDLRSVVASGHRLIETARRLSTFFEIRVIAPEHRENIMAFIIADRTGVVFRRHADTFDGSVCFNDPRHADELAELFEEMWTHAEPDPGTRALGI